MPADPALARRVQQANAARRHAADPRRLASAVRCVRVALEDGRLSPADILADRNDHAAPDGDGPRVA
jgi:uncharacterized tellurite resistance protein B-like protein